MAMIISVECKNLEEKCTKRDEVCNSLVGSPAFINNEILVGDVDDTHFVIMVGNDNDNNVTYDLSLPEKTMNK